MQSVSEVEPEVVDDHARMLAREYVEGRISDCVVRERFAELVFRTGVAQEIARSRRVEVTSHWDDLEEMVLETLTVKTFAPPEQGGLDVGRIADGASLTGWARQLGRLVASSKHRDLRVAASRATPFSVTGTPQEPTPFEHLSVASPPAETCYRHARDESVLEMLEQAEATARSDAGRVRAKAGALRAVFDLPPTVADPDLLTRYHIRSALAAEPSAALTSLRRRGMRDAHPLLSPMWVHYDDEAVATVEKLSSQYGHDVAKLLLTEPVAAEPCPPVPAVRALKSHLAGRSREPAWRTGVCRLTDVFLAVACAPLCAGDRRTDPARRAERLAERHRVALTWPAAARDHVRAFPSSSLGRCTAEIAETLLSLLDVVLDEPRRLTSSTGIDAA